MVFMKMDILASLYRDRRRLMLTVGAIVVVTALIALRIVTSISGGEYQPNGKLYVAIALLSWALLAIIGFGINVWVLLGKPRSLTTPMRIATLASGSVLALA